MKILHFIARTGLILLLAKVSLAEGTLPYYDSAEFTPLWFAAGAAELESLHQVPSFGFVNQDGESVTERDVAGGVYVANFFFTSCPGICPGIQKKLARVQEHFRGDEAVKILTHTIRPTADSVDTLKAYAKANDIESGQWHLLTGDKVAIYELAKNVYFANEDLGDPERTDGFLHTENLLLIDQNRHIRGVYNGLSSSAIENLIADIEMLKDVSDEL